MQVIKNLQVKEEVYIEKLENGLTVMVIPKKETLKHSREQTVHLTWAAQ